MNFGDALELAKQGKKVARSGWNGKGMFVFYQRSCEIHAQDIRSDVLRKWLFDNKMSWVQIRGHLDMKDAQGEVVIGWLASQTDMLAEDWEVVE